MFDKIVEKGQYSEKEASATVKKMLSSVDYLHEANIAHRDLKVNNEVEKDLIPRWELKFEEMIYQVLLQIDLLLTFVLAWKLIIKIWWWNGCHVKWLWFI